MVCKGEGAAVAGSWEWVTKATKQSRETQLLGRCKAVHAGLCVGDNARKGAAVCAQPTLIALMGFFRILLPW